MLKDWILIDESSGLQSSIVELTSLLNRSDIGFETCKFPHDAEFFLSKIGEHTAKMELKGYVVLTKCPEEYTRSFISNNVINADGLDLDKIVKQVNYVLSNYGREKPISDKTWFISDTHFGHGAIIGYCNRPWKFTRNEQGKVIADPEEITKMDETMISNWNRVVGKDDTVYHLGDFAFGKNKLQRIPELVSRLNGRIHLVLGNHDKINDKDFTMKFYYDAGFYRVHDTSIVLNKYFVLSHAPMEFLNGQTPFVNIYGHVHDSNLYKTYSPNSVCVCVERHDYTPISFTEIQKRLMEENEISKEDL